MSEVTDESARGIEAQITDVLHPMFDGTGSYCPWGSKGFCPGWQAARFAAAALAPLIATAQADALPDAARQLTKHTYLAAGRLVHELADRVEGGEL